MDVAIGVVFIHGFLSSPATWARFCRLLREDPDLGPRVSLHPFAYRSPLVSFHPLRRTPSIDDAADSLRTFLSHDLAAVPRLVLVSHSQGGLVAQRLLARVLGDSDGSELDRLRLIVMYACPNAGSDLALPLRRWAWFWRNRQERELRPLQETVTRTQAIVLDRIVRADRIPVKVYAGESDAVVPPVSARSVFPGAGTVPGDHSTIVQPDSRSHRSYIVLKHHLLAALAESATIPPPRPAQRRPESPPRPADRRQVAAALPPSAYGRVVDGLLAVPGMTEPSFRDQLYARLPDPVRQQLPRHNVPRLELVAVLGVLDQYRHLGTWDALARALELLAPALPAVDEVAATLTGLGLTNPRAPSEPEPSDPA